MVNDFLFELGCEELPSGAVQPLVDALAANLVTALDKAQIAYRDLKKFATPRRLAIYIAELAKEQPSQSITRRGPALSAAYDAEGKPSSALLGFAKSCGVELDQLSVTKTDKGEWITYESINPGLKTKELLASLIQQSLANLPIAKPMRWGEGELEFSRPVHWALLLYANEPIPCTILGLTSGNKSYGHRFHHPKAIKITDAKDYEILLENAFVIADFSKRREIVKTQVNRLAVEYQAKAIVPEKLLDEVTSIVEWPQALIAHFEKDFLKVPSQALIAAMQVHQKCFALMNSEEKLLAHFITVANISSSNPAQVIAGNEKVMRARLSDAVFFFEQDKKKPLSQLRAATDKVLFQVKLGSLLEKSARMQTLMEFLAEPLNLDKQEASRAAELSKCDLLTGMVGEFPELQGLMGYYYAKEEGEPESVAMALNEQYMPRFSGDQLPSSPLGVALSLADRLDTLVGIFAIGAKPSGVKDPFKLRRHALAVVRLLISTPAKISLSKLIHESIKTLESKIAINPTLAAELKAFILERLASYYQSLGFGVDLVLAVRARQEDWLYDTDKRIHALSSFIRLPEAAALSAACKRVTNILEKAEDLTDNASDIQQDLLEEGAEKSLLSSLNAVENRIKSLYQSEDYAQILTELASLREPVDVFFDQVMVMVDDPAVKKNRLTLLKNLQEMLQNVADISLLQ